MDFFERVGRLFPNKTVESFDELMNSAGREISGARFLGFWFIMSLVIMVALFFLFLYVQPLTGFVEDIAVSISSQHLFVLKVVISFFISFVVALLVSVLAYSYNSMLADVRREAVESVLPDFLVLVASNMRSGMSLDQAMWNAATPEFGILSIEVRKAIKESFSGTPLDESLIKLSKRIPSLFFKRTVNIIIQALKSGGEIANILEKTSEEARDFYIAKKEVKASLVVYVIFLVFASVFGVPFLMAVSTKMIDVLYNAFSIAVGGVEVSSSILRGLNIGTPPITPKDFYYFSIILIFISNFLTSFIIGAAYTGNKNDGVRYIPFMLIISYVVFFLSLGFLESLFSVLV